MRKNSIILCVCLFLCMAGGGLHAQTLLNVTDELPCDAAPTVYIGNIIRRVTVVTTHENKVRLVSSVAVEGNCRYTNEEWLEKLELKVSGNTGDVHVKCGNMQPSRDNFFPSSPLPFSFSPSRSRRKSDLPQRKTLNDLTPNGTVVFDSFGHWLYKKGNIRRDIIVYVPVGAKLQLESRYAETIIDSNVSEVNARIVNGGLTMKDAERLTLKSSYGSVYALNIGHAEVALNNGWFHARRISTLDILTKGSTVELDIVGEMKINSNDDEYEMDQADVVSGGKNYGSLRVVTLRKSLDLTGINADIKVHNIGPDVSLIKIDGQYADLRLPVDNLKDYTVNFEGKGSNIYTPFAMPHPVDSAFTVKVGTGKKNSFRLKCNNCTLDMK